jgi:hypothetical protein
MKMKKYGNQKIVGILMSGIRLVEIELLIDIYLYSILCEHFAK